MDFPKILNETIFRMSSDVGFANFIRSLAPHPSTWPDCVAKELALEFFEVVDSKNLMAAMVKIADVAETLERKEIHFDNDVALNEIIQAINYGNGLALAHKIKKDPANFHSLIQEVNLVSESDCSFDISEKLEETALDLIRKIKNNESVIEVKGFPNLSDLIGGFNDSRIGLVVAGSGVGKTTFLLNLVLAAMKTMKCLFVNMEMSVEDIIMRIVCIQNSVNIYELRKNEKLVREKFAQTYSFLLSSNSLFITDGRGLTLQQINSMIYRKSAQGVKLFVIDYDQKIKIDSGDQEWNAIRKAVESLEETAKATKSHIIVLAQGDEDNTPKASKRSVQPCSYVLALYKEGSTHVLESKKNRFGRSFKLRIDADLSKLQMREGGEYKGPGEKY